ncbi:lantibiotic dehydratase [Streptacidiphilus sp. P02-A3a]|uniref:lantibiotic dehydratase n=1 Tax=Streptacidiphilus sp. P02-A3a TaxID=2704468 RepID=UPI0015FD6376|nr:lantibiotic dehydratase [Streptacidiphilus sp. P02-A3a]QMU71792.1 lantibiotic dehydratase [Streptacidiphilus sp. P02-A3a]
MAGTTVPLGDKWQLWRQFALRGPGFPADGVLRLAVPELVRAADALGPRAALTGPAWKAFEAAFAEAAVDSARELQRIAARPDFQAAVAWQNRAVVGRAVEPFVRWEPSVAGRTSSHRQREELVAHYWQRFCVKNDTIGFFGPVGWGELDPERPGVTVEPGAGLLSRTEVYFSSWSIDELVKVLNADPGLRDWVAPRRMPYLRISETEALLPGRPPQPATDLELAALRLCDGRRPVREIRRELADRAAPPEVEQLLEQLVRRRWIVRKLEVPAGTHPERHLRDWLERVGDETARRRGLRLLEALERGRARVAAAAAGPELTEALAALESDFRELTDAAATREKGGSTAPCRTLVYADSIRSATATVGAEVLRALAPLDLLLTSATWLTSRLASRVLTLAEQVHDRLSAAGGESIDLASFWFACMPVLHGDAVAEAAALQHEFWQRWSAVLRLPERSGNVTVASADIAEAVRGAFDERSAGWTAARYLSPDVMLAADGREALERGEFELVVGELHVATNTLGASLFVHQHPAPDELFEQTSRDHPQPRLMPLLPKEHRARLSTRVRHALVRPEDYQVALLDHGADPQRERTVASADAVVERQDGRLVVRLPDGAVFGVLDVFAHVLTTLVIDLCRLLPEADHTPRITVDRLVLARETWRYVGAALDCAQDKSEARRFVRVRRWHAATGLPRFVFVTAPTEPRPFFVDFDSPAYVSLFAKAVRRLTRQDPQGRLTVTEMLPTPEQTWLTDDQGNRYTSELRFVVLDD